MTEWRLVHQMPDGQVWVTVPAVKSVLANSNITAWLNALEIRARAARAIPPEAVQIPHHRASELPDRADRAAWRINPATGRIHVDPAEKARLDAIPQPRRLEDELADFEKRLIRVERRNQ